MPYAVVINRSAERELKSLPPDVARRIGQRLRALSDDQHPAQSKRLRNSEGFRLRVGDYRAIYAVDDAEQQVTIIAIGHRRDVYRRLE
ncbi:MAG: type II toxin-antitoxin system RelE family toxin [Thermomicrobiales bacterium]